MWLAFGLAECVIYESIRTRSDYETEMRNWFPLHLSHCYVSKIVFVSGKSALRNVSARHWEKQISRQRRPHAKGAKTPPTHCSTITTGACVCMHGRPSRTDQLLSRTDSLLHDHNTGASFCMCGGPTADTARTNTSNCTLLLLLLFLFISSPHTSLAAVVL